MTMVHLLPLYNLNPALEGVLQTRSTELHLPLQSAVPNPVMELELELLRSVNKYREKVVTGFLKQFR